MIAMYKDKRGQCYWMTDLHRIGGMQYLTEGMMIHPHTEMVEEHVFRNGELIQESWLLIPKRPTPQGWFAACITMEVK